MVSDIFKSCFTMLRTLVSSYNLQPDHKVQGRRFIRFVEQQDVKVRNPSIKFCAHSSKPIFVFNKTKMLAAKRHFNAIAESVLTIKTCFAIKGWSWSSQVHSKENCFQRLILKSISYTKLTVVHKSTYLHLAIGNCDLPTFQLIL